MKKAALLRAAIENGEIMNNTKSRKLAKLIKELNELCEGGVVFADDNLMGRSNGMIWGDEVRIVENLAHAIVALHTQFGVSYAGIKAALEFAVQRADNRKDFQIYKDMGDFSEKELTEEIKKAFERDRKELN